MEFPEKNQRETYISTLSTLIPQAVVASSNTICNKRKKYFVNFCPFKNKLSLHRIYVSEN